MMPLLVAEAKLFSDNVTKNNFHIQLKTIWDFAKTTQPKVNYPRFQFEWFLWRHMRNIYITARHRRIEIYSLDSETPFFICC